LELPHLIEDKPDLEIVEKGSRSIFKKINIKSISYITLILNSLCIILGVSYIIFGANSIFWEPFGIILTITLFENLIYISFITFKLNKSAKNARKLVILSYAYLTLIICAILVMMVGNLFLSSTYNNHLVENIISFTLIFLPYFAILFFGMGFTFYLLKIQKSKKIWISLHPGQKQIVARTSHKKQKTKKYLKIFSYTIFVTGIIFAIVIIFGSFEIVTTLVAIIAAQFGIFFSIIFAANTILLLNLQGRKLKHKKTRRKLYIGIAVSLILLLPYFMSNFAAIDANQEFSSRFGYDWQDRISPEVNEYFLTTPFSTPGYYFGISPKDCIVEQDVLFHEEGDLKLFFDAYLPLNEGQELPGNNSVIIRIHGGGWVFGDKGAFNSLQMNEYFAAQGYAVFDVQYGLYDGSIGSIIPATPDNTQGDFTIDDMVGHIGLFTKFLENHTEEYNVNLNSVFISGGSSGGHLTCAVALAIASGNYPEMFSNNITVKGYIPFYPANGQMIFFGVDGSTELKNPELLIRSDSPPCLIFQGTHDILNYFGISTTYRDLYLSNGNDRCAIIWMPMGGHGCDFYFSGYYNQIFLYYMERFIYLHR